VEWMAIKPNEIETMKEPIERAHGRVITFGLGLGYFTYMASLKKEVESVTVIERSEDVISLFKTHILPHFDNPEKINIVCADAFEYAKEQMPRENFDYAFVDLWRDTSDGVDMYIKMKKLEALSPKTHFEYWIEKSILVMIRKRIFASIMQSVEDGKNKLTYDEIMVLLADEPLTVSVMFPEGFTTVQIAERLEANDIVGKDEFLEAVDNIDLSSYSFVPQEKGDMDHRLDGYLFPDTYKFEIDSNPETVIYKMLNRFSDVFKPEYYEREKKMLKTIIELEAEEQE
jgi:hypothetical protein